jgi:hypothetical protein
MTSESSNSKPPVTPSSSGSVPKPSSEESNVQRPATIPEGPAVRYALDDDGKARSRD